jgi:hypothetical protein
LLLKENPVTELDATINNLGLNPLISTRVTQKVVIIRIGYQITGVQYYIALMNLTYNLFRQIQLKVELRS